MPVEASQTLIIIVILLGLIAMLLVAWRVNVRRQLEDQPPAMAPSQRELSEARLDPGEEIAEPVIEQIESMVHARLAGESGVDASSLDFGANVDGSLAIWYRGTKYESVEQIPEPRVRRAVREAVEAFNRPSGRSP